MGIFIHLNISDTITADEWERAYQKSVKLMEKMPFIEKTVKEYYGASLVCTTKMVEKDWYGKLGWHTIGDSVSMKTAEDYFLPKNIIVTEKAEESAKLYVDPYMSILPAYSNLDFEDERCDWVICLWGKKRRQNRIISIYWQLHVCWNMNFLIKLLYTEISQEDSVKKRLKWHQIY